MAATDLTSVQAKGIAARHTYNTRPALTWTRPKIDVDDLGEWTSNDYEETFYAWKIEGLRIYLELAAAIPTAPPDTFPSQFDFKDGKTAWPDKSVIKIGLKKDYLAPSVSPGKPLFFKLTDAGRRKITKVNLNALPSPLRSRTY